jgi:hypothetical protein
VNTEIQLTMNGLAPSRTVSRSTRRVRSLGTRGMPASMPHAGAHVTGGLAPPGLPQQYNVTGNLVFNVILDAPKGSYFLQSACTNFHSLF